MIKSFIGVLLCSVFFTICSCFNRNLLDNPSTGLIANYHTYHAALGSGKGIIFNIPIPGVLNKKYTIDSFYVNGKSIPFSKLTKDGKISIEANVLFSNPPESISIDSTKTVNNTSDWVTENIILNRQFQPAYLMVHNDKRKYKIYIESFNEIKPEAIY